MQFVSVVFLVAVAVQSLYLILLLVAFLRKRVTPHCPPLPVSVVVCAHDEEQNLRTLIPLLLEQRYPEFEVIVVNDRSNDGTYDWLLKETKNHPVLRMVHVDRVPGHVNGKKYGITLGIKAAAFEWILLTDADCRPAGKNWIDSMASAFDDNVNFVTGISPYLKEPGLLNLFIRFESWITSLQYIGFALLGNPYMGVGRNLAYRKSLFLDRKGFNQFLGVVGGDDDLFVNQHARRSTLRVNISPEALVTSVPKRTWKSFFYQKVRHLAVGKLYRLQHRILLGIFGASWIITWLAGLPLLLHQANQWWVAAALILRIVLLTVLVQVFVRQNKMRFEWAAIPLLDFLYSIYYISTGLVALLTKKVQWRK